MAKLYKYKLMEKCGNHFEEYRKKVEGGEDIVASKEITAGQTFTSPRKDLLERFRGKFEFLGEVDEDEAEELEEERDVELPGDTDKTDGTEVPKNVTESFPVAQKADLSVFQYIGGPNSGNFYVVDNDKPDEQLNKEPLTSKKELVAFLKKQTG